MKQLILLVCHLRGVVLFKISVRMIVVLLMVAGAWVATQILEMPENFSLNDKIVHIIVFFGFSVLMDLSISRHSFWLWKGLPLLVYGIVIEIMQFYSPDRTFSLLGWVADFFGILLYFIAKVILSNVSGVAKGNSEY